MGIFRRYAENRRLRDVEERLENAERALKVLRLEWEDAYDRLRHVMGRLSKRAAVIEKNAEPDEEPEAQEPTPNDRGPAHGGFLTAHQREMQQRILRRRGGG